MPLAPRNAPCPCGSGLKFKKCCGVDRAFEPTVEERHSAIEGIALLALRSPRFVPLDPSYDRWVEAVFAGEIPVRAGEAFETLGPDERQRIADLGTELFPTELSELSARCGEDAAIEALLTGAVAAGMRDYPEYLEDEFELQLELIEESRRLAGDPLQALAIVLDGGRLWDAADAREVEREIRRIPDRVSDRAYEKRFQKLARATVARLATDWHSRRLSQMVGQVDAQLPLADFPRASAAIRSGCERFTVDEEFRLHLASILLGDQVGREQLDEWRSLLLAA